MEKIIGCCGHEITLDSPVITFKDFRDGKSVIKQGIFCDRCARQIKNLEEFPPEINVPLK